MKYILVLLVIFVHSSFSLTYEESLKFQSRDHTNHNTGVKGTITIQDNDASTYLISSNGVPDHPTGAFNGGRGAPNFIQAKRNSWVVPKNPEFADTPGCLNMGPIGVAINGVPIYNPYTRNCCDAGAEELNLFDECWGHPSPGNTYHYHTAPLCLFKNYCGVPSEIVGVAFDGFPIYGPNDELGNEIRPEDLDECNGRTDRNGNYKYHITAKFPYFLGCYKGKVITQNSIRQNCECTKPVSPCPNRMGGFSPASTNMDVSNLLSSSGSFKCCVLGSSCDHVTNTNTNIPTADANIQVQGGGMMGQGMRPGQGGMGQGGMRPEFGGTGQGGMEQGPGSWNQGMRPGMGQDGMNQGMRPGFGGPNNMRPGMRPGGMGGMGNPNNMTRPNNTRPFGRPGGMRPGGMGGPGGFRPGMGGPGGFRPGMRPGGRPGMGGPGGFRPGFGGPGGMRPGGFRPFGMRPPMMGNQQGFGAQGGFGQARPRPSFGMGPGNQFGNQQNNQNDQSEQNDQEEGQNGQNAPPNFSQLMQIIQNFLRGN